MSIHDVHEGTCHVTTSAVRAGIDSDTAHGAVTPPIVLSSNFSFERFGHKRKYDYTRSANPTRDLLGEALAELEGVPVVWLRRLGSLRLRWCCTHCSGRVIVWLCHMMLTVAVGVCSMRWLKRDILN